MSVLAVSEAHLDSEIQAQPYIPRSEEWRTASGSIGSAVWEMVPRTVDPNCYDSLDDDAIMKHYLDPPCAGLVAPYLPRQKKSRFQRIRSMLKSAPSSPVPSLPQNDHLLSKSTAIANTAASDKANDAEEETEARLDTHETIVRTVEDMAIGLSSSVCSQASTISSTISEPSASTCTTSTSRDDICDRSTLAAAAAAAAAPQSFLLSSSRLRLAFSRLRSGDQGAQIVAEPARHKCRDVFLNAMKRDSLAGRIRNKLQRPKSATATATPHQKILRSHSMSSIVPYQQRKSDSSDALRRSATATLASTEAQGPKGILRSQPRDGWDRCVLRSTTRPIFAVGGGGGRRQDVSSRPLRSSTSASQLMMIPQGRLSMPFVVQASETSVVRFASIVSVRETFSRYEYDRAADPKAVCTRLTPAMAQYIKQELNMYKLHEMHVHQQSRVNTHFFL